ADLTAWSSSRRSSARSRNSIPERGLPTLKRSRNVCGDAGTWVASLRSGRSVRHQSEGPKAGDRPKLRCGRLTLFRDLSLWHCPCVLEGRDDLTQASDCGHWQHLEVRLPLRRRESASCRKRGVDRWGADRGDDGVRPSRLRRADLPSSWNRTKRDRHPHGCLASARNW